MRNALIAVMIGSLAAGCTHEHVYTIIYSPNQSNTNAQLSSSSSPASRQVVATNHLYTEAPRGSLTPVSSNSASRIYSDSTGQPQSLPATEPPQGILLNEENPWNPQDTASTDADRAIVRHVRQSVRQDYALSMIAPALKITAQNGHVVLGGTVENETERRRLTDLCQKTPGVVSVEDKLAVKLE
jgi:hypothetical protein